MKKNYRLIGGFIVLLSLMTMKLGAQGCISASQYPGSTITIPNNTPGVTTGITTCQFHEYAVLNFVAAGIYSVTNSEAGDWCTITNNAAGSIVYFAGPCPVTFTITTPGTYYFHFSVNGPPTCDHTGSSCIVTAIGNISGLPCTGVPAFSVAAATGTVCPGGITSLSMTPASNFNNAYAGLTYQWFSAPNVNGPYSVVASATNIALQLTVTASAYYELVATCSSGPSSFTSNAVPVIAGVPSNIATNPTQTLMCMGGTVGLSIPYTFSGVTYSWQTSSLGIPGTFTSIATATNSTYNFTNNVTGYYQAAVSCTANSTFSLTTNPVQIVIQGLVVNNIPYTEGFESVVVAGQLPNCSWFQSGALSVMTTYTAPTTTYRLGDNSTHFFGFNGAVAGDKYLYTNGLNLKPGITYSATVRYETEYTGLTNFTDLSIMVGSTQTTVGLSLIVSSNGPVSANNYRTLSGTFQVPTTGVYYIAYKESNTAATDYLTLDNISVTIPCSLNSPTLAVAGASVVCAGNPINLTASGANSYTWTNAYGFSSTNAGISNNPGQSGVVAYSVTGLNSVSNCTAQISKNVTIVQGPVVSPLMYDINHGVCTGATAILYATGSADSYTWSTTGLAGANTTISPTGNTTYTVSGSNSTNCTTKATIDVIVYPPVSVAGASSKPIICVGESVQLTGSNAITYTWTSNSAVLIGSPVQAMPSAPTNYQLVGTDENGCTGSAIVSVNVDKCTGISSNTASNNSISVYPNPNSGEFTVESNSSLVKTINVTDVTGRIVMSSTSTDSAIKFNINNLSNGVYYVKVQSAEKATVTKIVKQ